MSDNKRQERIERRAFWYKFVNNLIVPLKDIFKGEIEILYIDQDWDTSQFDSLGCSISYKGKQNTVGIFFTEEMLASIKPGDYPDYTEEYQQRYPLSSKFARIGGRNPMVQELSMAFAEVLIYNLSPCLFDLWSKDYENKWSFGNLYNSKSKLVYLDTYSLLLLVEKRLLYEIHKSQTLYKDPMLHVLVDSNGDTFDKLTLALKNLRAYIELSRNIPEILTFVQDKLGFPLDQGTHKIPNFIENKLTFLEVFFAEIKSPFMSGFLDDKTIESRRLVGQLLKEELETIKIDLMNLNGELLVNSGIEFQNQYGIVSSVGLVDLESQQRLR